MNSILQKKIMTIAAIFWLSYLFIHMFSNLQFFSGKETFNGFYDWFNNSIIIYFIVSALLLIAIILHVFVAVSRQLDSNKKRSISYQKNYPHAIPRSIAWTGAGILLSFIMLHVYQMLNLTDDLYQALLVIFSNPFMWLIYGFGLLALGAHLHHGLGNIAQTFGWTHQQNQTIIISILVLLIGGFSSVPISIILSGI